MLDYLPIETIVKVAHCLQITDICNLCKTCGTLNYFASGNLIWRTLTFKHLISKSYADSYVYLLERFAEKCSWRTCYHVLHLTESKKHPNFWEDVDDITDLKFEENLGHIPVSGAAKLVVEQFLAADSIPWTIGTQSLTALSQVIASVPQIPITLFTKTLFEVAAGPYETGEKAYLRINTFIITLLLYFKKESYKHPSRNSVAIHRLHLELLQHIIKKPYEITQKKLFDASSGRIQFAVLHILVTILYHHRLKLSDRHEIQCQIKAAIWKEFWINDTDELRTWIVNFANKKSARNSEAIYIDLFNTDEHPYHLALQMTTKQQLKLTFYKLDEYVKEIVNPERHPSEDDDYFMQLTHSGEQDISTKGIRKIQRQSLPAFIVGYFTELPSDEKSVKLKQITHLLDIAKWLHKMNNFYCLKEVLGGIRGILTFTQKTGVSWCNVDFSTLMEFVQLETIITHTNDYELYRDIVSQLCTHTIPILSIHLNILNQLKKSKTKVISSIDYFLNIFNCVSDKGKSDFLKNYLYFDMEINKEMSVEAGKIYDYFTRR